MSDHRIRVGVFGASGAAGQDLMQILAGHEGVEVVFGTSNTLAGEPLPGTSLTYSRQDEALQAGLGQVDVVILALPHKASAQVAKIALDASVRVVDLSADFRLDTPELYAQWYEEHPHPELLPAPYGLPEMRRDAIRGARLVAVPGCYATTTLLGLYPLLQVQALDLNVPVIVDAKSGISGAGRNPNTKFDDTDENLIPYSTGRTHRHLAEIEQEMRRFGGSFPPVVFTPHLLPIYRGLMASLYITLNYSLTADKVHNLYTNVYADEPLVQVLPQGEHATFRHAAHTNRCVISVQPVMEQLVYITSVTDNLRKGASGQAVQCMNLMFDLPETTGLL